MAADAAAVVVAAAGDAACFVPVVAVVVDGEPVVAIVCDAVAVRPGLGSGAVVLVAVVMYDASAGNDGVTGGVADVTVAVASAAVAFVGVCVVGVSLEAIFDIGVGAGAECAVAVAGDDEMAWLDSDVAADCRKVCDVVADGAAVKGWMDAVADAADVAVADAVDAGGVAGTLDLDTAAAVELADGPCHSL